MGAQRRAPLRRPDLGGRGRPAHRTGRPLALTALIAAFEDEHQRLYGVRGEEGSPIEIRALRVGGLGPSSAVDRLALDDSGRSAEALAGRTRRRERGVPVRSRESIGEAPEPGPLLVDEYDTTVVVRRGWTICRDPATATLILERDAASAVPSDRSGHAADRGQRARLDRGRDGDDDLPYRSLDRRPRRDGLLGCALRRLGRDIAQAVTVPFHLGSVPHAMDTLLAKWGDALRPGDVFVMNDPFDGGIHLQDIFVFEPVFQTRR